MIDIEKIFKYNGKTISYEDILAKIYANSNERSEQISKIVEHLRDTIRNTGDASVIAPWIAEYLATSVKNDDNLIKLAAIISRLVKEKSKKGEINDFDFSEFMDEIKREVAEQAHDPQPGTSKKRNNL